MTGPAGYSRSTYVWRNEMMRPLDDEDAQLMLGAELSVSIHGTVRSSGIITDAKIVDDGERLQVTIESGGRFCAACYHVYDEPAAQTALVPLGELLDVPLFDRRMYSHLTVWTRICRDSAACWRRQVESSNRRPPTEIAAS